MRCQISVERFEVGVRALARHEAQLHQLAGRIVDEDQQRARLATLLEPAMIAAASRPVPIKAWFRDREGAEGVPG